MITILPIQFGQGSIQHQFPACGAQGTFRLHNITNKVVTVTYKPEQRNHIRDNKGWAIQDATVWENGVQIQPNATSDFMITQRERDAVRKQFHFQVVGAGFQKYTLHAVVVPGTKQQHVVSHVKQEEVDDNTSKDGEKENGLPTHPTSKTTTTLVPPPPPPPPQTAPTTTPVPLPNNNITTIPTNEDMIAIKLQDMWNKLLNGKPNGHDMNDPPLLKLRAHAIQQTKAVNIMRDTLVIMSQGVEAAIQDGSLAIRKGLDVHRDVGFRDSMFSLLSTYDPDWLHLGLAIATGTTIQTASQDVKSLVFTQLTSHPTIVASHTYTRDGPFMGTNMDFATAISKHFLHSFLSLVLFLDKARLAEPNLVSPSNSCLFVRGNMAIPGALSKRKSTEDLLREFGSLALNGEGDFIHHIRTFGYTVHYRQTPLDEYVFHINDLSHDLRDGMIFAKYASLYCGGGGNTNLLQSMRVPAINRVHKLSNVKHVLDYVESIGVPLSTGRGGRITNRDVVDGNRDKTMSLVWILTLHFSVELAVNKQVLVREICRLAPTNRNVSSLHDADLPSLLLLWSSCATGKAATDMVNSFRDGTLLCLLVRRYHPDLVPMAAIVKDDPKHNFAILRAAVDMLGAVPLRLDPTDVKDEMGGKMTLAFLAYLCARLVETQTEARAAKTIQTLWALFKHRKAPLDVETAKRAVRLRQERLNMKREEMALEPVVKAALSPIGAPAAPLPPLPPPSLPVVMASQIVPQVVVEPIVHRRPLQQQQPPPPTHAVVPVVSHAAPPPQPAPPPPQPIEEKKEVLKRRLDAERRTRVIQSTQEQAKMGLAAVEFLLAEEERQLVDAKRLALQQQELVMQQQAQLAQMQKEMEARKARPASPPLSAPPSPASSPSPIPSSPTSTGSWDDHQLRPVTPSSAPPPPAPQDTPTPPSPPALITTTIPEQPSPLIPRNHHVSIPHHYDGIAVRLRQRLSRIQPLSMMDASVLETWVCDHPSETDMLIQGPWLLHICRHMLECKRETDREGRVGCDLLVSLLRTVCLVLEKNVMQQEHGLVVLNVAIDVAQTFYDCDVEFGLALRLMDVLINNNNSNKDTWQTIMTQRMDAVCTILRAKQSVTNFTSPLLSTRDIELCKSNLAKLEKVLGA